MIDQGSHSKHSTGWVSATIFNIFILALPLIAANVLISGYAGVPYHGPASAETLADTAREIDSAFEDLSENGQTARTEWANLVSENIEARNMSAARGFLLAAPQMLRPADQRSILAAAASEPLGSEDERLLRAALLFVPSDIRIKYETSLRPRGIDLIHIEESEEFAEPLELAAVSPSLSIGASASLASMTHTPAFSVLGTPEDLVGRSRDWMRGNRQRAFEMRLTGIAMASPPSTTGINEEELIQAASILKTAWRSGRLQPQYARILSQRLSAAVPDDTLTENLEIALSDIAVLDVRAKRVQDAFTNSIDPLVTARLAPEFEQIATIASLTSPRGGLSLLEHVKTPTDISRARLLVEAGGDRAVALITQIGPDALQIAGSTDIEWNRASVIGMMLFAAALMVLLLSWASVMHQMAFGKRKTVII